MQYMLQLMSTLKTRLFIDKDLYNHSIRVSKYVEYLHALFVTKGVRDISCFTSFDFSCAAVLHDIGKLNISRSILDKADILTDDELNEVKRHPLVGYDDISSLLANISPEKRSIISDGICYHHEKWDGSGYPYGLSGEGIPLIARVIAIADVYDALMSARVYKAAWSYDKVFDTLSSGSGEYFDPELIKILEENKIYLKSVTDFVI